MKSKRRKIYKIIGLYMMILLGGIFILPQRSMAADMTAQPAETQQGETLPVDAQTAEEQTPPALTRTISQTGWIKTGENWWYREADGSFPLKEWKLLNQIWYYFDENGWMVTGWQDIGDARYYFNTDGYMLTGWRHIEENDYYFQDSGVMAVNTWIGEYYVDGNGVWDKSKHKEEIKTGWVQSDGKWKYCGTDGSCVKDGWKTVGGAWYLFDKDGWMLTGWQKVSGTSYYMDASGRMVTGWQKIGGIWYYLNDSGAMLTGWQRIGGIWYYMEISGKMLTGWQKLGQTWYYMDIGGRMLTGWQQIGSNWYYMDASGAMAQDTWIGTYYVDADGSWIPGRIQKAQWVKSGSRWWYQEKDGSYPALSWKIIGGAWYYFDGAGWMATGWQLINKVWYYMNGSGVMQTGWQKIGSSWYYLNSSGQMLTGWQKIGNVWYYLNGGGAMLTGWQKINNVWYYLNGGGVMQTGWQKIGSSWYYLLENGSMVTGWQTIGGHKYYLYESGAMACSTTVDGIVLNASGQAIEVESGSGTLRGFLETALAPVGETLYVYGGGHDGDAGGDAVRIGVNPQWKTFYNKQGASYDYTKYRYWHGYGLDCSGFVGWTVYNTFNTVPNKSGYSSTSTVMPQSLANRGLGTAASTSGSFQSGDIVSKSGHVWMILGTCSDGSVVIVHATPPVVQISGSVASDGTYNSQAVILAKSYMKKYYSDAASKYNLSTADKSYLNGISRFRWSPSILKDPDGFRNMTASQILKVLFGEA